MKVSFYFWQWPWQTMIVKKISSTMSATWTKMEK